VAAANASAPSPVVFALHGDGGTGRSVRAQMDLERLAQGRAIFVYPESPGGWDLDGSRDVVFFDSMLFAIANGLCVDLRRVFVTGFSNGAYMANQLACRRGERIRGVATHAGGGPYETQGSYDDQGHLICPGKAVAALVVHGLADDAVTPSEGQKSIDHWTFANRCSGGGAATSPPSCTAHAGCAQPVVSCKVQGLGHAVWGEGKKATWAFFDALR
jgi:polyhydroxybutyrate depolymerase